MLGAEALLAVELSDGIASTNVRQILDTTGDAGLRGYAGGCNSGQHPDELVLREESEAAEAIDVTVSRS